MGPPLHEARMSPRRALVTGSAGFIGYHLSARLLAAGWTVTGLDAMTDYYDVTLKARRHALLAQSPGFTPVQGRVEDAALLARLMAEGPDAVIHLAAQAGVRHSIDAPRSYLEANLDGSFTLLEAVRARGRTAHPVAHTLMASTSSVYGANTAMPYTETDRVAHPMSFYAATKLAGEAMAHAYAHLYDLPLTLFRFFTVYGPWGRPDMALFRFTRAILAGAPIDVYNRGEMQRDFTYVADLVEGIVRLIDTVPVRPTTAQDSPEGDSLSPVAPWRVVNIGTGAPVRLLDFIAAIEAATGKTAEKRLLPIQPGDVPATWADGALLERLCGPMPKTPLDAGVAAFVGWYRDYYGV